MISPSQDILIPNRVISASSRDWFSGILFQRGPIQPTTNDVGNAKQK
jgi:hypothetical protein